MPQPLLLPWARPRVACRLEPLHVEAEFDITVQPEKSAFGAPLVRIAVPLVSSPSRQIGVCMTGLLAMAALVNVCARAPFSVELPK